MISVLIPTYNDDCSALIAALCDQAKSLDMPCEVVVGDDCSPMQQVRTINRRACEDAGARYLQADVNLGPARLRNRMADDAHGDYMLFIDSDAMPVNDTFLAEYASHLVEGGVVCGGFAYKPLSEFETCALRYKYGVATESEPLAKRARHPYASFKGVNFCAHRTVMERVRFEETIHFGYEDAWFGLKLREAGIPVRHIDNPVWHLSRDTSEAYLGKIRRSIDNVSQHIGMMQSQIKLLRWYAGVRRLGLTAAVARAFRQYRTRIETNLTGDDPSLQLFAFYKLGYLCTVMQDRQSK